MSDDVAALLGLISLFGLGTTGLAAFILFFKKRWAFAAISACLCLLSILGLIVAVINTPTSATTVATETESPEATASPEPTDSPTPGPCDVQTLRGLDTQPGADILAGNDPSDSVQAAAKAERECAESLSFGSEAYARHVVAEGDEYVLGGTHGPDEIFKKMFFHDAIYTVQPIADDLDVSSAIRAKAQEIIDTANEKLQSLGQ